MYNQIGTFSESFVAANVARVWDRLDLVYLVAQRWFEALMELVYFQQHGGVKF